MQTRSGYRLLLGVFLALGASAQAMGEYQVKAAFLYNFARFVQWPAVAFNNDKEPVRICVLGKDPFGGVLEEAVRGKKVSGRSFVVAGISDPARPSTARSCSSARRRRIDCAPSSCRSRPPGFSLL